MVCKLVKAGQTAMRLVRYVAKKAIGLRADLGFGFMRMRRPMLSWAADVLRANRDSCRRASEVRHVILSAPKDMPRRTAIALLYSVFSDWRTAYAPGRQWVAAVQNHNGIFHLHAAVSNVDASGRPLRIQPHHVLDMAEMKFTTAAISARGKGKSKGVPVYSKAKKLAVRDLAALLVSPGGGIRADVWEQLKMKKLLSGFRERKDGSVISFEFGGKRIRLAALHRFLDRCPDSKPNQNQHKDMPTVSIKIDEPLPDSIAAKLVKAGFSAKDLTALATNLHSASLLQQHAAEKAKTTLQPIQPKPSIH